MKSKYEFTRKRACNHVFYTKNYAKVLRLVKSNWVKHNFKMDGT